MGSRCERQSKRQMFRQFETKLHATDRHSKQKTFLMKDRCGEHEMGSESQKQTETALVVTNTHFFVFKFLTKKRTTHG